MRILLLALLPLIAGCTVAGPPPVADADVASPAMTTLNRPTRIGDLVITPITVVEDSRCPINARCVWAGRLILITDLRAGRWHEQRQLVLGVPHSVPGGLLSLVSAEPGKLAGAQSNPPASRFAFEVTR